LGDRINELERELAQANTFIEILKAMVEQTEDPNFEGFDLEDLARIASKAPLLKSIEVDGVVIEGRKYVREAMEEGVKFVIKSMNDMAASGSVTDVRLISVGKDAT